MAQVHRSRTTEPTRSRNNNNHHQQHERYQRTSLRRSVMPSKWLLLGVCIALASSRVVAQNDSTPEPPLLTPAPPTTAAPTSAPPAPTSAAPPPPTTSAPPTLTPSPPATTTPPPSANAPAEEPASVAPPLQPAPPTASNATTTDDAGMTVAPTLTPSPTSKSVTTRTQTPRPTDNNPDAGIDDDKDDSVVSTVPPTTTRTSAPPNKPRPSPAPLNGDTTTKNAANSDATRQAIIVAVIAAVAALSILSLLLCCCRSRRRQRMDERDDRIDTPPAAPLHSTATHVQQQQQQQYEHASFDPMAAGYQHQQRLPPPHTAISYAGLPTTANGVPMYPITSPEMPATSQPTSRLEDLSRRTRSINHSRNSRYSNGLTSSPRGFARGLSQASSQREMRYTDASDASAFSIDDRSATGDSLLASSSSSVFNRQPNASMDNVVVAVAKSDRGSFEL